MLRDVKIVQLKTSAWALLFAKVFCLLESPHAGEPAVLGSRIEVVAGEPATPAPAPGDAWNQSLLMEYFDDVEDTNPESAAPDSGAPSGLLPQPIVPSGYTAPLSSGVAAANGNPLSLSASWNHGLELHTQDQRFRVHIGGRTQVDAVFLNGDNEAFLGTGGEQDGDSINLRRGRLRVDGTMFGFIDWACEYDFVNTSTVDPLIPGPPESNVVAVPAVTDLWVNFKDVPLVGNIKLGNFKDPIGFEHLHSSRYLNFLERSFDQDAFNAAFNNGFAPGVMLWDNFDGQNGTWATGVFKNTTNIFAWGIGDGEYNWTSRGTYLLYYDEPSKGENLVHIGLAGSLRDPNNGLVQYRSRGSLRNGPPGPLNPVFANTSPFAAESVQLLAAEFSAQRGPLLINAEYEANWNQNAVGNGITSALGAALGEVFFHGWYVEALYFLTGEHRDYDRAAGVYGRVIPHENFHWSQSSGAWQVGVRYSQLNLKDHGINGGFLQDVTLGLNWFLNPNLKLQWNYVVMDRDAPANLAGGTIHGAGMRLAFDF